MNKKGNRSYYIGEITKLRSVRKAFHLIEYCNIINSVVSCKNTNKRDE